MASEATETPVILYETLAPLGEEYDNQSLGLPSYALPLDSPKLKGDGNEGIDGVSPVSLSVDVISSSTSLASISVGEICRSGRDETPASSVLQSKESGEAGAVLYHEEETCISVRSIEELKDICSSIPGIVENGGFETETVDGSSSRYNEEIGFLSLESEVPGVNEKGQVQRAEEQNVTFSNKALKEAPPWARTRTIHGTWFRSPFLQLHQVRQSSASCVHEWNVTSGEKVLLPDEKLTSAKLGRILHVWKAIHSSEIVDFCNFVTPTEKEQKLRDDAVQRVREVVLSIWPSCQVKVFGSFATGLYLPTSDIDVVILESGCQVPQDGLKALAKALNRKNLVKNLQVIGKARVPIVKFVEAESKIPFDISFDVANGPEAAEFIKAAMANLPPLKPLCMVLKIFLQQRELNEVYTGGIGSYALLVMLLTHLQTHPSRKSFNDRGEPYPLESNLGILLVDFFDFYGRALNVRDVGISCRGGGRFYSKRSRGFADNGRPYLLSVEDPQKPDNDIGKNSYNVTKVRSAFMLAHRLLTKLEVEDMPEHVGLLGRIVRLDKELTRREVVLPELPPWLHSAKKLPVNKSSSRFSNEKEILTPEVHGRLQWHEDEEFPRGGELERLSQKRKRAKDRAAKVALHDESLRGHKRKRGEVSQVDGNPGSSSGRVKKGKHRKESETGEPSPSYREARKRDRERRGPVEKKVEKGKSSKQRKLSKRDHLDLEAGVEEQFTHSTRNNKRSKRYQMEDSHEEGEITLEDDATFARVGNGRDHASGNEVILGVGNGHNKHKRWRSESGGSKDRRIREGKDEQVAKDPRIQEVINEAGTSSRKVMVTSAHKKVMYS